MKRRALSSGDFFILLYFLNCAVVDQVRQRKPENNCGTLQQIQS